MDLAVTGAAVRAVVPGDGEAPASRDPHVALPVGQVSPHLSARCLKDCPVIRRTGWSCLAFVAEDLKSSGCGLITSVLWHKSCEHLPGPERAFFMQAGWCTVRNDI